MGHFSRERTERIYFRVNVLGPPLKGVTAERRSGDVVLGFAWQDYIPRRCAASPFKGGFGTARPPVDSYLWHNIERNPAHVLDPRFR